jgi:hypothetical protein
MRRGELRITRLVWDRLLGSGKFARRYREERTAGLRARLSAREEKDRRDLEAGCLIRDEVVRLLAPADPVVMVWSQVGYRAKGRKEQPWLRQGPAVDE